MATIIKDAAPLPGFIYCVLLDLVGYCSYAIPWLGEFSDIIWAPVSAFIFYKLFGGKMGLMGGTFSFIEEILPFSDFIPTFSISWLIRYCMKADAASHQKIAV